jgi:type I restriction-modification system DNA methylase subunit
MENSKLINQINQLFHNKGVKQEERFNLLMTLLEKNNNDEKFSDILSLINNLDYSNCDLIQEIFMSVGSKYTKFNLDQFYTPLTVSKFISQFMKVGDDKNAIDPAGGTGDLLLFYKGNKTVWDIDENALKLCKFNYNLNKQYNYNLVCKNSLENFEDSVSMYSYSVMNPPFGSNTVVTDEAILNKFELGKGKKKQEIGILFLELGLKLLKNDGILFIIVPAGYVGNGNKICSDMRELILKNRLIASISLPENTFKRSGTGVNTYLLIVQKKAIPVRETYNILISNINNIGYNLTKKETPLKYKLVKETGEIMVDQKNKPILDNDFENLYDSLCSFVNDNNISFTEGSRNTSCTIIIGYALHLGLSQTDLEAELQPEIKKDGFILDELNILFAYFSSRNYGKFWSSKAAKKQYKF